MKPIIALLMLCLPAMASAKCAFNGIYPLSENTTLNKNGLIVLEFYASSQSIVPELNKKYPVYLQAGKEKVILVVVEVLKGEFQVTQVIFKPAPGLKENTVYTLHIDNLPEYERAPRIYNEELEKWEAVTFRISPVTDQSKPSFLNLPAEAKKTMVEYGCGPARWVYFNLSKQDESETFVRARVKNLATGKQTEYILAIKNGQVMIGHGMCSGPFHFENGTEFEVSFSLMDQSGNKSEPTKNISFQAPVTFTDEE